MAAPAALQAQVFTSPGGPGNFGTPYGYLGQGGTQAYEEYRKQNDGTSPAFSGPVTGTNVAGNNSQVTYNNLTSGAQGSNFSFNSPGVFFGTTQATATPSSSIFDLESLVLPTANLAGPLSDNNAHTNFDIRIGFVASPTAFVSSMGGDLGNEDLFQGNWGTTGVYMHLGGGNWYATPSSQPNWSVTASGGPGSTDGATVVSNAIGGNEQTRTMTPVTGVYVTSGLANTAGPLGQPDNGTPYNGPLELSEKMTDLGGGNVQLSVKAGNTLYNYTFAASSFPAWQTSYPVVFIGQGAYVGNLSASNDPGVAKVGVLFKGDANGDGKISLADYSAVTAHFGQTNQPWANGDFNQTGQINLADYSYVTTHFGQSAAATPAASFGAAATFGAPPPEIDVNTVTGDVQLKLNGESATGISGYEIDSSGHLVPGNWHSVSSQALVANWQTLIASTSSIAEAANLSNTLLITGATIDLGNIFTPGAAHDLAYCYTNAAGDTPNGVVVYTGVPEPGSLVLFGLGAVGLSLLARRRVRQARSR